MTAPTYRAAALIAHLERRAAILSASSAWGTDEDAMLMQQAAAIIRELVADRAEWIELPRMEKGGLE